MKTIFLLFIISNFSFSQCISGDCKNGFGKYDYGFAVYEGNFKSEKPNGKGTMDYGNGEKFVGNFKDGQEDGEGVLYKKNSPINVIYSNGKMKIKEKSVVIGGNAPTISGCVKGDCYNGFGIIKFESGNRYEGNFKNGVKSGEGSFFYAQGNEFTGTFEDNKYTKGIFKYHNEKVTFDGEYNEDGSPKSGKYYYDTNKATVIIANGIIIKVDNPVARKADSLAIERSKPKMCLKCGGKGMIAGVSRLVEREHYYSINYVNNKGNIVGTSSGNVGKSTRLETSMPTQCNECRGSGEVYDKGMIINTGRY